MNKKGFTLIELLAVIVILAIIALIATPAVLNIIEDSKESAAKDSASVIAKAAETYYISNVTLQGEEVETIDLTDDTLNYKGEKPEKGYVTFDEKGNAYLKMYMNGYCVVSDYDNTVVAEKMDSEDCTMASSTPVASVYIDMQVKYYDPTGATANCTSATAGSANGTNSGCMKWYVYAEQGNNYLMFLDHNVSASEVTYEEAVNISTYTSGWTDRNISEIRLMSATEVDAIVDRYAETATGYGTQNQSFDVTNSSGSYFFTTGTQNVGNTSNHPLGWLFDNLGACTNFGCYTSQNGQNGYWLKETVETTNIWRINNLGGLYSYAAGFPETNGARPVISVSKSRFTN